MERKLNKDTQEIYRKTLGRIAEFKDIAAMLIGLKKMGLDGHAYLKPLFDYLAIDFETYARYIKNNYTTVSHSEAYFYGMLVRNLVFLDIREQLETATDQWIALNPKTEQVHLLDFGCGNAVWSYRIYEYLKRKDIFAVSYLVDRNSMLEFLTDDPPPYDLTRLDHELKGLKTYWSTSHKRLAITDIKENNIDIIVLSEVLHGKTVPDGVKLLEDLHRILTPTGILIVIENNSHSEGPFIPMADNMSMQMKVHRNTEVPTIPMLTNMLGAAQMYVHNTQYTRSHNILTARKVTCPESLTDH